MQAHMNLDTLSISNHSPYYKTYTINYYLSFIYIINYYII